MAKQQTGGLLFPAFVALVLGALVAFCSTGGLSLVAAAVAGIGLVVLVFAMVELGDGLTRALAVLCAAGVLAVTTVGLGALLRNLNPAYYRHLRGVRVEATVPDPSRCQFFRSSRGHLTNYATCDATWTVGGRAVHGTVEVNPQDMNAEATFTVAAWALGDQASAASRVAASWNALNDLSVLPWWPLPVGLVVAVASASVAWRVPGRRRQQLAAAHGWSYHRTDPALAAGFPEPAVAFRRREATAVLAGERHGLPFVLFTYSGHGGEQTAYAMTLPFASVRTPFGEYVVDGDLLIRSGPLRGSRDADLRVLDEVAATASDLARAGALPASETQAEPTPAKPAGAARPVKVRTYRRPLIGATVGAALTAGGIRLIQSDHPFLGVLTVLVFAPVLLTYAVKLVSARRTRAGRRSLAARRGWSYQEVDPTLPGRLGIHPRPGSRPGATAVLSGSRDGVPLLVFDYRDGDDSPQTVYLMGLARAVPRVTVHNLGVDQKDSQAGIADELIDRVRERGPRRFGAEGTWIWTHNPGLLAPRPADIERALDGLAWAADSFAAAESHS